jgi:hypothetical protein
MMIHNATPTRLLSSRSSSSSPLRMTKFSIPEGFCTRGVIIKLRLYRLEDFVGE